MSIIICYLDADFMINSFLCGMPRLTAFDSNGITKTMVEQLEKKSINMKRIFSARSDGAAVLTGKKAGV